MYAVTHKTRRRLRRLFRVSGPRVTWFRRRGRLPRRRRRVTLHAVASWAVVILAALLGWSLLRGDRLPEGLEPAIAVWNARAASLHEFSLEGYVRGVVAAEMPTDFHPEALKAQAVAARTYALRRIERGPRTAENPAAHISSDFQVNQAWIDEAEFVAARPEPGARQWQVISEAVEATRGVVLTYEGEPIDALYHSTSGGHTEDAARYFVAGQPYLRAVPDPYGDHSPVHESQMVLSIDTVLSRLGVRGPAGANDGEPVIRVLSRTEAGRAAQVQVVGSTFTGRHVRESLGLRSNWFDATVEGDRVVFDVRGNGHGVGMSQYGADGMARAGFTYEQILGHYYPGTVLERRY